MCGDVSGVRQSGGLRGVRLRSLARFAWLFEAVLVLVAASKSDGEGFEVPAEGLIGVVLASAMRPAGNRTATPRPIGETPCDIQFSAALIFNCVLGSMRIVFGLCW